MILDDVRNQCYSMCDSVKFIINHIRSSNLCTVEPLFHHTKVETMYCLWLEIFRRLVTTKKFVGKNFAHLIFQNKSCQSKQSYQSYVTQQKQNFCTVYFSCVSKNLRNCKKLTPQKFPTIWYVLFTACILFSRWYNHP